MAFKVLNEAQVMLLTKSQKEQYERELDIYIERVAFVEKLRKLEEAEIAPYEPKLQGIAVIEEVPQKEFRKFEYAAKSCTPVKRPECSFNPSEWNEPVIMDLPACFKMENFEIVHIQDMKRARPRLPETARINPAVKNIQGKRMQAEFAKAEPDLPKVAVKMINIKVSGKLERTQPLLPAVKKPDVAVEAKKIESVYASLPIFIGIKPACAGYRKTEVSKTKLPVTPKTKIVIREFLNKDYPITDLPVVSSHSVSPRAFELHKYKKSQLPLVGKVCAAHIAYKPFKPTASHVTVKPAPGIAVKQFAKVEGKVTGLPDKITVSVPNALGRLRGLHSVKDADEVLEETNS